MSIIHDNTSKLLFARLTARVLTYRLALKDARQLEYRERVRGGVIASVLLRTKDNADLPGIQGGIGPADWQALGFASGEVLVGFLKTVGVARMKQQRRTSYRASPFD